MSAKQSRLVITYWQEVLQGKALVKHIFATHVNKGQRYPYASKRQNHVHDSNSQAQA